MALLKPLFVNPLLPSRLLLLLTTISPLLVLMITRVILNNKSSCVGKYVVLFFYPKDFTFVCPTEIIAFSDRAEEFEKLNTKLIACSCDTVESHLAWIKTPRKKGGLGNMKIPIIGDNTKEIASKYGVLVNEMGIALRGLFLINPEGVIEHITMNNFPVGRNVDEVLRLIQATQFVAEHGEVCPANWKPGDKTINPSAEKSLEYFGSGATESAEDEELMGKDVIQIKDEKQFHELVKNTKNLVVDFYAPWCGKCKMISPFYNKLASDRKDITFASVDTTSDRLEKFSADFGIHHLPSFHFFKEGKEVGPEITGYYLFLMFNLVDIRNK